MMPDRTNPPMISQVTHGAPLGPSSGGCWWLCANTGQSASRTSRSLRLRVVTNAAALRGDKSVNFSRKSEAEFIDVGSAVIGAKLLVLTLQSVEFAQGARQRRERARQAVALADAGRADLRDDRLDRGEHARDRVLQPQRGRRAKKP